MKIDSLKSIWNNLGYISGHLHNFVKCNFDKSKLIYNCSPVCMADDNIKNTYIEVGYMYLFSRVPDDSQGFIYFECIDKINYDKDHKICSSILPEQISDKLFATNNKYIAQIYNKETQEYLHKNSNIEWHLLEGQALFTSLDEANDYIEQCKNHKISVRRFSLNIEKQNKQK